MTEKKKPELKPGMIVIEGGGVGAKTVFKIGVAGMAFGHETGTNLAHLLELVSARTQSPDEQREEIRARMAEIQKEIRKRPPASLVNELRTEGERQSLALIAERNRQIRLSELAMERQRLSNLLDELDKLDPPRD